MKEGCGSAKERLWSIKEESEVVVEVSEGAMNRRGLYKRNLRPWGRVRRKALMRDPCSPVYHL